MDVIANLKVKSLLNKKAQKLSVYFDNGSPFTFVREDKAKKLSGIMQLPTPHQFEGLGNGKFYSNAIIELRFNLLNIWCSQLAYVVGDKLIEEDILAGHDFMQRYNIKLDVKNGKIILDKKSLLRAQKIKSPIRYCGSSSTG